MNLAREQYEKMRDERIKKRRAKNPVSPDWKCQTSRERKGERIVKFSPFFKKFFGQR